MDWDAIAAISEVFGAIAVVVTLIYLARQIHQSTVATRIASYHQAQEQLWSVGAAIATNRELAEILARTYAGGIDQLAVPDRLQLESALASLYFGFENMLVLHEKGFIDTELWQNVIDNNARLLRSPLSQEYLASRRGGISRRLEAAVEERLKRVVP